MSTNIFNMKLTKEIIISELKKREKEIKNKFKVRDLYLYGSFVNNSNKENSDIDIIVEFKYEIKDLIDLKLQSYLYNIFKIDVCVGERQYINPIFKESIEGTMVKCL